MKLFPVCILLIVLSSCSKQENEDVTTPTTPNTQIAIIGNQTWSNINLDVATYSDGTPIPQVTTLQIGNAVTTGAWCYYSLNTTPSSYGKLYNWYAVAGIHDEASKLDVSKRKKLAPTGWHIASDAEWTTLTTFLGGEAVAGRLMKGDFSGGVSGGRVVTSNSFNGLPGGAHLFDGSFWTWAPDKTRGYWWSTTQVEGGSAQNASAYGRYLESFFDNASRGFWRNPSFLSVRCIKD